MATPYQRIRLGYSDDTCKDPLSYPSGEAHGLLCSPTRGGKFRDVIAQILLTFEGSCFVIDPKGQAAAVTARYRKEVLKQDVCVLNPFNILPEYIGPDRVRHAQYDPLKSKLRLDDPNMAADADNLAEGLMPHSGSEVHWIDSARMLCSGMCLHAREKFPKFSLVDIYSMISARELYDTCQEAVEDKNSSREVKARLSRFAGEEASENREIRSVVSTAITRLGFIGNKPIADNLRKSTVDFRDMKKKPMTVYVILPGRYLAPYAAWLRTITNSWADACLEEVRGAVPILGILDEFKTAVGNLNAINTLNALGAGYNCQLLTVLQDLTQLQDQNMYPRSWETFLANSGFKIFFSPRDWTTSEYISKMTGTIEVHPPTKSVGMNASMSTGSHGRRYMLPEDCREMSENQMLAFIDGVPGVVIGGRRPYYEGDEFKGKYDTDPYHQPKS